MKAVRFIVKKRGQSIIFKARGTRNIGMERRVRPQGPNFPPKMRGGHKGNEEAGMKESTSVITWEAEGLEDGSKCVDVLLKNRRLNVLVVWVFTPGCSFKTDEGFSCSFLLQMV
ncbi:hypothetical protein CHARACLAT_018058 [Characodon lateralis]|uniref:Uncharacterized protein n=1 Tax=Characodon lateralis TaxID=208331 RepID=A0ABU7CYL0_9TELE|nr:hypothetical protein [Characodon lateralis]